MAIMLPLFFAHGPDPDTIITVGLLWLLVAYGLPVLTWVLGKRRHKTPALVVGGVSVALTGCMTLMFQAKTFAFYAGLALLPLVLSVVVFAKVIRSIRKPPPGEAPPSSAP